jgi:hypothetical protein
VVGDAHGILVAVPLTGGNRNGITRLRRPGALSAGRGPAGSLPLCRDS